MSVQNVYSSRMCVMYMSNELNRRFVLSFCVDLNYTVKLSDTLRHLESCFIVSGDVQWRGCMRRDGCWKRPIINVHCALPFCCGITGHNGQLPVVIWQSIQAWHADIQLERAPLRLALKLISFDYILDFVKETVWSSFVIVCCNWLLGKLVSCIWSLHAEVVYIQIILQLTNTSMVLNVVLNIWVWSVEYPRSY